MRLTRPLLLLALAALLAPRAEAARTSVWESTPPAAVLTTTSAAGLLAPLAPAGPLESTATNAELTEPPRFDLGDVVLVESPYEDSFRIGLADVVEPPALRGPPLLEEDPRQAFELRDPETRIRGFELLPAFRIGASASLSLWGRQACGFSCREVASDSRYDPWGLFWSAAIDVGFTVWDTVQVVRGGISKTEYSARMALNVAALTADAATGGFGGGAAVRTVSLASRAGRAGRVAVKTAIAVDRVNGAVNLGQAAVSGIEAAKEGDVVRAGMSVAQLGLALHGARKGAEQTSLKPGQRAKDWSPTYRQNNKLKDSGAVPPEQSHHLVQDAAVADVASSPGQPSYSYSSAPARNMEGGSGAPGSPHDVANRIQESAPLGGSYGDERDLAYLALRAAGESRATARAEVGRADRYFVDFLGWTYSTPTVVPSTRPAP